MHVLHCICVCMLGAAVRASAPGTDHSLYAAPRRAVWARLHKDEQLHPGVARDSAAMVLLQERAPRAAQWPRARGEQQPPHGCGHVQLHAFLALLARPQVRKIVYLLRARQRCQQSVGRAPRAAGGAGELHHSHGHARRHGMQVNTALPSSAGETEPWHHRRAAVQRCARQQHHSSMRQARSTATKQS